MAYDKNKKLESDYGDGGGGLAPTAPMYTPKSGGQDASAPATPFTPIPRPVPVAAKAPTSIPTVARNAAVAPGIGKLTNPITDTLRQSGVGAKIIGNAATMSDMQTRAAANSQKAAQPGTPQDDPDVGMSVRYKNEKQKFFAPLGARTASGKDGRAGAVYGNGKTKAQMEEEFHQQYFALHPEEDLYGTYQNKGPQVQSPGDLGARPNELGNQPNGAAGAFPGQPMQRSGAGNLGVGSGYKSNGKMSGFGFQSNADTSSALSDRPGMPAWSASPNITGGSEGAWNKARTDRDAAIVANQTSIPGSTRPVNPNMEADLTRSAQYGNQQNAIRRDVAARAPIGQMSAANSQATSDLMGDKMPMSAAAPIMPGMPIQRPMTPSMPTTSNPADDAVNMPSPAAPYPGMMAAQAGDDTSEEERRKRQQSRFPF